MTLNITKYLNLSLVDNGMKLKILIISRTYCFSGLYEQLRKLRAYNDLDVYLIVPINYRAPVLINEFRSKSPKDYTSRIIILKQGSGLYFYSPLLKLLRKIKPDVIYSEEEPGCLSSFQIIALTKLFFPKTKIVNFTWENIYKSRKFPLNFVEWFSLKFIDAFIAGNSEAKNLILKKGYKKDIFVLPQWGVNLNKFKIVKKRKRNWINLAFIGRFVEEKGIWTLLEVFKDLDKRYKLILIGIGPLKQDILEFIKKNKLKKRVKITKQVPYSKMHNVYRDIDILVLPSETRDKWKEQFGHVLIEAMAAGVAVIGSDSGAIPEVVGKGGLIFKEGNINDLHKKILMLENSKLKKELIRKALVKVKEYDIREVAKRQHEIFIKI